MELVIYNNLIPTVFQHVHHTDSVHFALINTSGHTESHQPASFISRKRLTFNMKLSTSLVPVALAFCASAAPAAIAQAPNTAPSGDNAQLLKDLAVLPTATDRYKKLFVGTDGKLLTGDALSKQIVFDYNAAKPAAGALGGRSIAANVASFPVLKDLGISTTVVFLEACGVNTPHVHPRATEMITVADGKLDFGMILENGMLAAGQGTGEVTGGLNKFQGTAFPQGSIHYQANPTCEQTSYVATLNSEDPGTNSIAQGFFGLNGDVVQASLGWPKTFDGKDLETFRKQIPATLAARVEACLVRCGIAKR